MSTAQAQASAQLVRLMDGFVTTQLLYVAAKLGVADVLADGPQTARTIADEVGADPGQLGRMLRGLVLDEVLAEEEDGRFSLTPLGACLRDDVPGSVRGLAIARGDLYYRAAAGLPQTAVTARPRSSTRTARRSSTTSRATRTTRPRSRRPWPVAPSGKRATWSRPTTSARSTRSWTSAGARDRPEAIRMDLLMLTLFGGARERSEAGYRSLLAQAGFRLEGIVPTRSPTGLSVIEAAISS